MEVRGLLAKKRAGAALSEAEIADFIDGYVAGRLSDAQATGLLALIYERGLDEEELFHWTYAMLHSGRMLDSPGGPRADKHSTGGVGDKVSIALAPAVAACGVAVPMVSGRALGHTGGTLDKLESIPGLRTELEPDELCRILATTGAVFAAQTRELVPADRKLYALRDATGLIDSIPLIASSILSKKLAEGIDALVLDVKFGSGAFLTRPESGRELARVMLRLAARFDLSAAAYQTSMAVPLGRAVGHALEVREAIECLSGEGPGDLRELVALLGGAMLHGARAASSTEEGSQRILARLDDGRALEVFARILGAQGGDPACATDPDRLPRAPDLEHHVADRAGSVSIADCRRIGLAVQALGGHRAPGRDGSAEALDPAVGLELLRPAGAEVEAGEPLVRIHARDGRGLSVAREHLAAAIHVGAPVEQPPLVLARVEA